MKRKLIFIVLVVIGSFIHGDKLVYGQQLEGIKIGKQIWSNRNLDTDKFANGDPIPEAKTIDEWIKADKERKPAWCYYDNNPDNGKLYGRLYNWYAITDPRGIAPDGWVVPTNKDWENLIKFLGGSSAARKLKSVQGWLNENGDNKSGFNAQPGGSRTYDGDFIGMGLGAGFMTSTPDTDYGLDCCNWSYGFNYITGAFGRGSESRGAGCYVRCIKK